MRSVFYYTTILYIFQAKEVHGTGAWDAPPPNRLEGVKRIFKAFSSQCFNLYRFIAALKRTGSAWRSTHDYAMKQ